MQIIVIGKRGQLARSLNKNKFDLHFYGSEISPIDRNKILEECIKKNNYNFIINASAYTAVDQAEEDYENAFDINVRLLTLLSSLSNKYKIPLIHFSTDYVFDGLKQDLYDASDQPNPLNVYGETKFKAENYLKENCINFLIIRTSWVYSEYGNNFVKKILELSKTSEKLKIVDDQIGCPTYAYDIAKFIEYIINKSLYSKFKNKILHYSGKTVCSWYEFANEIIDIAFKEGVIKRKPELIKISTNLLSLKAQRPRFSALDCSEVDKISEDLRFNLKDSLSICINKLNNKKIN